MPLYSGNCMAQEYVPHWFISLSIHCATLPLYATLFYCGHTIVANRPGMAGTVLEFWALSRWCPGWGKIPMMSRIYTYLGLP